MKTPKPIKSSNNYKGNIYDRIFKENAESLFIPIVEEELNLKIESYKTLPDKLPRTVEREVDFLYEVTLKNETQWILHIEFQTSDAKNMIYRMGMYHGLVWEKYKKPIKHIVIYLGKGKAKMRKHLIESEIFRGFELINIHELDTEKLLSSQIPEVIMLAMLSKYEKEQSEQILRSILGRIQRYSKSHKLTSKYIAQLIILSRLRNLEEETIKIIEDMPVTYDIQKDGLYKRGLALGIEKGLEKGMELVVIRGLENGMSYEQVQLITQLTIEQIKEIEQKKQK